MQDRTRGMIEMTSAMAVSGTIGLFVLLADLPVLTVVFWRCVFAGATLAVVCMTLGHFKRGLSRREWALLVAGGVAIVLNWLLLFAALPRASIAVATVVYNVQPFILLGFGALFLGEQVRREQVGWLLLAFVGLSLVVQISDASGPIGWTYLSGILMALGAAFFWAVAALITKQLTGTPPHLIALVQVCVGMAMLGPFVSSSPLPTGDIAWLSLLTLGIVHTGFVYILMYDAIHRLPTHLQGALSFLYPVVAVAVDVVVLKHRLSTAQIVGAAAILVAAAGMTGALRPARKHHPLENSV